MTLATPFGCFLVDKCEPYRSARYMYRFFERYRVFRFHICKLNNRTVRAVRSRVAFTTIYCLRGGVHQQPDLPVVHHERASEDTNTQNTASHRTYLTALPLDKPVNSLRLLFSLVKFLLVLITAIPVRPISSFDIPPLRLSAYSNGSLIKSSIGCHCPSLVAIAAFPRVTTYWYFEEMAARNGVH